MYLIHDDEGELRGTAKHAEDAAAMVSIFGHTVTSEATNRVVWTQGSHADGDAGESYDKAASVMLARVGTQLNRAKRLREWGR